MIDHRPFYEASFGPPPITEGAEILRGALRAVCDAGGRYYADVARLRLLIPGSARRRWSVQTIRNALAALQTAGLVELYTAAGETYLELTDFHANDPRPDGARALIQAYVFPRRPRVSVDHLTVILPTVRRRDGSHVPEFCQDLKAIDLNQTHARRFRASRLFTPATTASLPIGTLLLVRYAGRDRGRREHYAKADVYQVKRHAYGHLARVTGAAGYLWWMTLANTLIRKRYFTARGELIRRPVEWEHDKQVQQLRRETPRVFALRPAPSMVQTSKPARGAWRYWYLSSGPRLERAETLPPFLTAGTTLLLAQPGAARVYRIQPGSRWQQLAQADSARDAWRAVAPLFGGLTP